MRDAIRTLALEIGFDDFGFSRAEALPQDAAYMERWLEKGLHGEMEYLAKNREKRYDPTLLVHGAQTVCVGVVRDEHIKGDYHRHIKTLFYRLAQRLNVSAEAQFIFCDSAPVLERRWAVRAGLGWIGKNRNFFHKTFGSRVHLGEMMLPFAIDAPAEPLASPCGECVACIKACPTGALSENEWDARRCNAYQRNFCWICQDVCKFNKK